MKRSTVIITGHSQGLGSALAEAWLERGARVIGLSRQNHPKLSQSYSDTLHEISIDLADTPALIEQLSHMAWADWCHGQAILWLFNNAGIVSPSVPLGQQSAAAIAKAVALNVTAPLILADAVAAHRSPSLACHIVHISSGAAHKPYPGWSVYGASKAALDQHARNAHAERNGIEIVSIAPGVVDTNMQAQLRSNTQFPNRERFIDLHSENRLQTPQATAERIISYCLGESFAKQPVIDIRDI